MVTFNEATKVVEEAVAMPGDIDLAVENGTGSKVGSVKQARGLDPKTFDREIGSTFSQIR
jgi:3-hydroxyacyl-CoA dehydrogenase